MHVHKGQVGRTLEQDLDVNKKIRYTPANPSFTTPGPLYNMLHYNMVMDKTLITVGSQLDYFCYKCLYILLSL